MMTVRRRDAPRHVPARNRPLALSLRHVPREDQLRARGERGEEGGENVECRMMNMFVARFLYSPSEPILLKKNYHLR